MRVLVTGATGNVGSPDRSSLGELLSGLRHADGLSTPPLDRHAGGPARLGELATGVGARR